MGCFVVKVHYSWEETGYWRRRAVSGGGIGKVEDAVRHVLATMHEKNPNTGAAELPSEALDDCHGQPQDPSKIGLPTDPEFLKMIDTKADPGKPAPPEVAAPSPIIMP